MTARRSKHRLDHRLEAGGRAGDVVKDEGRPYVPGHDYPASTCRDEESGTG